jgi:NAD(P)-dependent dehydrogenase (short-subunit alcohol dehydrogenase family)|tara:strand:+ start:1290 stop:2063 length:774 start_codon:yes stop_codon:yes gene_type:complete
MKHQLCILVTGAASGIGRAIAIKFSREGWSVLGVDLNGKELDQTRQLTLGHPGGFEGLELDITETSAPERAVKASIEHFGRLDSLVNNAGIGRAKSAEDTSDEEWERFIAVNQTSVFRMSREALKVLPDNTGSIVNIASIAGIIGLTGSFSYVATKAAVIGMTRQLATDYGPRGIRTNAVAPGQIETPLTSERIAEDPRFQAFNVDPIPFPRLGHAEDIANAVYFLASDQAGYINGHTLVVDGGWTTASFSRRGYEM